MDILYLLIPLSAVLVLVIIAIFGWAVNNDQFDDLEREGLRVLDGDSDAAATPNDPPASSAPRAPAVHSDRA